MRKQSALLNWNTGQCLDGIPVSVLVFKMANKIDAMVAKKVELRVRVRGHPMFAIVATESMTNTVV